MDGPTVAFVTSPDLIGVDHFRVFALARALGERAAVVPLGKDVPLIDGKAPDVLVCSQRGSARSGAYDVIRERFCRPNRMLLVVDCCDDPLSPDGWVATQRAAIKDARGWTAAEAARDAISAADLVTVNTAPMAAVVRRLNPHVAVVPDYLDGSRWAPPANRRIEGLKEHTYVGVAGGLGHDDDWRVLELAWTEVARRHPGVQFVCLGVTPEYLRQRLGSRLKSVPWLSIDRYQHGFAILDIGCAPLADTKWNASKSPNRWAEFSLAGAATVASPIVYGTVIEDGRTGLLATTANQWISGIEELLDPTRRRVMVDRAREVVLRDHILTPDRVRGVLDLYARERERVYGKVAA